MTAINVNQDKASLYKKIAKVMGKVERIPKRGRNSFHNYDYVTESDLVDSARKLMVEEGLVLFNNVREYEINGDLATVTIDFTLCDTETGESISTCLVGQGSDKGDKAFYKAYAGATKYYLMKTFLIPTGDDPEADTTTDQNAQNKQNNYNSGKKQTGTGNSGGTKKVTDKQLYNIKQSIQTLTLLVDQDEDAIIESLKERIGFNQLEEMTITQASKSIETLTKWKDSYKNKLS